MHLVQHLVAVAVEPMVILEVRPVVRVVAVAVVNPHYQVVLVYVVKEMLVELVKILHPLPMVQEAVVELAVLVVMLQAQMVVVAQVAMVQI